MSQQLESAISFGYWVRRQRKALDLTQQMLAERVGCSLAAIKKIESDERRPSRQIAERLADILSVPAEQRDRFLESARGLRTVERLPLSREPVGGSLPSGTVTFLYTDIEGSTRLWAQHPEAMEAAHARHDQLLREAISAYNGYIFRVAGDSFCAAFHTVGDAVQAAARSQLDLGAQDWGETPIRARMGIHTGKAELQGDGPYRGYLTLSHVQRLMSAAHGGQVLLSFTAQELVREALPQGIELRDLGMHQFKDWDRSQHVFQLVVPELPSDFPPLKLPSSFLHNLPIQLTSFVGRARELMEVRQLLSNTRLLTLTGPGGTGKTRLALQLAAVLLEVNEFPEGICFVELASLANPALVSQTLASVLGLREQPGHAILDALTDYVRAKTMLLILDNCEHLLDACARLSNSLLHASRGLKILATSREPLGIAGETTYRVPSLPLPSADQYRDLEALSQNDCVRLFVERARAVYPGFLLKEKNGFAIAEICRRLDGIPLAIELAAARTRILPPEDIASRLDDRFRLLTGGSRTALERHQTLRALIDWSHNLLSEAERVLLRRLAVFSGGFNLHASETICGEGLDGEMLDLLVHLVDKSLIVFGEGPQGGRYRLPETIWQYARDKLLEAGESEQMHRRHMDFFLKFAEEAQLHFDSLQEPEWVSRLEADNDNLRAAMAWALEQDVLSAMRLGSALYPFWYRHGQGAEGSRLLREALEHFKTLPQVEGEAAHQRTVIQIKALGALQVLAFDQGDRIDSVKLAEEVVELSRRIGQKRELSAALSHLGLAQAYYGEAELSHSISGEAIALARELADKVLLGLALVNMAAVIALTQADPRKVQLHSEEGLRLLKDAGAQWEVAMVSFGMGVFAGRMRHFAEARSQLEACLPLFDELKDRHRVNTTYSEIAHVERQQGHSEEAKSYYRKTLLEWQRLGHRAAVAHELECLAMIAQAQKEGQRAAMLFGAAELLREQIHIPMTPSEQVEYDHEVGDLRASMDETALAKAWADGRALTMEQAIALAEETAE